MSFEDLHIIIIVRGYINKVSTIQTERPNSLGIIEDICPHHFSGAMFNFNLSSVHLVLDEKYLDFICLVHLELDRLPLISRRMVAILSWYIIIWSTKYPCAWMK